MKTFYQTPSLTVAYYDRCDIVTASIPDDTQGFNLDWVSG